MFRKLISTTNEYSVTIMRVALGVVFFPHGSQKLLGWFGGNGFSATMGFFTHNGIPAPLAFLAIAAEFFGAIGLITGLLGRVAAFGVGCVMVVAVLTVSMQNGFFMNWTGKQSGEGFEFHILAIALALAIMIKGSGALSVDWLLSRRK